MKNITGHFEGTGSIIYLCIGFVPDWVKVWNLEATNPAWDEWNEGMMRCDLYSEGLRFYQDTAIKIAELAAGAGIIPYYGGEMLTSTMAGTVTYGEGEYLKRDKKDYRYGGDDGDATSDDIDTWTLYSGYTGHFNEDVTGTYIGEGSEIWIDGKRYMIQSLSAGAGEATNEVTLSHTGVPSGNVEYIGGKWGYKPMIAGETTLAGFACADATVNADGEICAFSAGQWGQ